MGVSGEALETLFFSEGEGVKTSSEEGGCHCPQSTYIGRDETRSVYLPTQLERTLQLYW
jgi:hypothetical protein